ncbi:hypothetical protein QTP86_029978 [Hemibagrus guttatus]|nr:hypothetical protein QTP86_029978 [Hemibagrus guttatus]
MKKVLETGIGKVVNSFRKHDDVGDVAKTLVHRWKKLVPSPSVTQHHPPSPKEPSKTEIQKTDQEEKSLTSQNTVCPKRKPKNENLGSEHKLSKNVDGKSKAKPVVNKLKDCINSDKKNSIKRDSGVGFISKISIPDGKLLQPKEKSTINLRNEQKDEVERKVSDVTNNHRPKISTKGKKDVLKESLLSKEEKNKKVKKRKEKNTEREKNPESNNSEMPSMSFEEYLSYDLEAPKQKKRLCEGKNPKRIKLDQKQDVKMHDFRTKSGKYTAEAPTPVAPKRSVMDLLNVPLPTISPECEDPSQYLYFTEKKVEEKACEEAPVFTGQRLNKKMQVYSGTKVVYLPTMMSLYQQCIRTLQNNIDSLYEIGGVPFEILEPVLERCTPEQLLRIEECNPAYMGVTDHLWERHCLRDFRNAQLEEYESWREMYLRLFEERERRFQELTKSIVSAHSSKPKGRQVKMAFIHSVAKPPRNVLDALLRIEVDHASLSLLNLLPLDQEPASPKNHEGSDFGDDPFLFQHDCTPVHKARSIKTWMSEFGVEELDWPAQSPDLNLTEYLWDELELKLDIDEMSHGCGSVGLTYGFTLIYASVTESQLCKCKRSISMPETIVRYSLVDLVQVSVRIGAVLSQHHPGDNRLHPCAFFSQRLSSAERNYAVGERELLAIKVALEEWRNWLEGTGESFIVWTNHKNLEYLWTAKRLNPRQARWALFFGRFRYSLSYRPGSTNSKPDALSHQFTPTEEEPIAERLLPSSVVIRALHLDIERRVQQAITNQLIPERCPEGKLFIPAPLRSQVLQLCHNSRLFCHLGSTRTLALLLQSFWWPSVWRDVRNL